MTLHIKEMWLAPDIDLDTITVHAKSKDGRNCAVKVYKQFRYVDGYSKEAEEFTMFGFGLALSSGLAAIPMLGLSFLAFLYFGWIAALIVFTLLFAGYIKLSIHFSQKSGVRNADKIRVRDFEAEEREAIHLIENFLGDSNNDMAY